MTYTGEPGAAHGPRAGARWSVAATALLLAFAAVASCSDRGEEPAASAAPTGPPGAGAAPSPTQRPTTAPPSTAPPTTAPPSTAPPSTAPPSTAPPSSASPEAPVQPSASATASRTPAPRVLFGRGDEGAGVRELQARLAQISWFDSAPTGFYGRLTASAVDGFQARRGLPRTGQADTVTWARLLGMTTRPTAAELSGEKPRPPRPRLDPRCLNGRVLCVSKATRSLSWVVDGTVRATLDVRFGSEYTPTREGVFQVFWKSRHHVSTLYDTPMPYAMFFSGGQAVHYSADFAAQGYNGASHGCVNVRDKAGIAALFAAVRTGDKVVVHR
ncbi:L,D-transpeptidase family protein [Streptomyces sp. NPDC000594]|uniref:L,D-transpeptidase family protein n=1 Tax=Streptomyces sp. NPDC000594 TaxID=3154261 RepID=UPI00331C35B7